MGKFLTSLKFALSGVALLFGSQRNARIQLLIAALVVIAGFAFELTRLEWVATLLCIGLVFAAECFNTAIEQLADALHPDQHPKIGKAKDLAAGAVLIVAIAAAVVGAIIFLPHMNIRF